MNPRQWIYVLLYNARTDNEGIHTELRAGKNTILMFETEDDAVRYADYLEAGDFPLPTVEKFEMSEIEEFCTSMGFDYAFVNDGDLKLPPTENVSETDWQAEEKKASKPVETETVNDGVDYDRIRRQLEGLL
jgi:hypothetical protein